MRLLPSLSVLRSFEAAAKHESFTRAAEELRVTQGAISRMVRELETHVGVTLFRPEGRGVSLTEAGRNLAQNLHDDLERLRVTIGNASAAGEEMRTLSIGVLPTFGARWLAPRLAKFRKKHPNIEFALYSRSQPFDLGREGIDLAIHFGRENWVDGTLTKFCPEDLVAVASPLIVEGSRAPEPAHIQSMPLLHLRTRSEAWPAYYETLGLATETARRGATFDQFSAMIAAATHSLGAAIVPTYLIEAELAEGSLVVLGQPKCPGDMYYVVTPRGISNPDAAQFRDWIVAEARSKTLNSSLG